MAMSWSWATVMLALLSNFLCSGIIFGFAPLQLLFEQDGVLLNLCPEDDPSCGARVSRLVLLYTIGTTSNVLGGFPCGFLVDWVGPLKCCMLSGVLVSSGLLLLGLSPPDSFPGLALGAGLMGGGGALVLMESIPVPFLVPSARRPFVVSAVNCLFDASSVVFLGLYQLFAHAGWSRAAVLGGYAGLCAALHAALVLGWCMGPAAQLRMVKTAELQERICKDEQPRPETSGPPAATEEAHAETSASGVAVGDVEGLEVNGEAPKGEAKTPPLHGLPLRKQLPSFEFAFAAVFLSFQLFRSNTYLGTNKQLLEELGDAEMGYLYTQIFTACLPASTVCLPLISLCLTWRGFADTFLLVVALGAMWSGAALVASLPVQLLSFAAFTNFRAFLYSAYFVYITHTFGSRTSASTHGLITLLAAFLNFLIWPCTALAESGGRQGFFYLYLALLLLCLPLLALVLWLRGRLRARPEADCRAAKGAA